MGRTIASITQTWQQEEAALKRFERALRREDQILLDELLVLSRLHLAEASYASNLYPLDMYLIAIMLELYKQLKAAQKQLNPQVNADALVQIDKQEHFLELLNASVTSTLPETQEMQTNQSGIQPEVLPEPAISLSYAKFEEAP
ncbi:MAG: hypothetical protein ACOYKD_07185 [Anaerolineaceae bacterium]|jgi:hypothetical protein